jgi:hypothetical protein
VPGEILERKTYPFEFSTVEMQYESYNGVNVRLRFISVSNPFYATDEATDDATDGHSPETEVMRSGCSRSHSRRKEFHIEIVIHCLHWLSPCSFITNSEIHWKIKFV